MHINDCLDAILLVAEEKRTALNTKHNYQVYHLGNPDYIEVSESAKIIINQMGLAAKIEFTGGRQGWIGDNPFVFLDVGKMQSEGWGFQKIILKTLCVRQLIGLSKILGLWIVVNNTIGFGYYVAIEYE